MGRYSKQQGYQFEREIQEGLIKLPGYFFKIPDSRTLQFRTIKVPADFLYLNKNGVIFIEAKSTILNSFPLRNIKEHQLETGVIINSKTMGIYYFVIFMRAHKRIFIIKADDLNNWIKENPTKASVNIYNLEKLGFNALRYTARYNDGKCAYIDLKIFSK